MDQIYNSAFKVVEFDHFILNMAEQTKLTE